MSAKIEATRARDRRHCRGPDFLKASTGARLLCVRGVGAPTSLRMPIARSSRLSVLLLDTVISCSSRSHWHRSMIRQRTPPRPRRGSDRSRPSPPARHDARRSDVTICPGAFRSTSPSGPCALNRSTQSRTAAGPSATDFGCAQCGCFRHRSPPAPEPPRPGSASTRSHRAIRRSRVASYSGLNTRSADAWRTSLFARLESDQHRVEGNPCFESFSSGTWTSYR